MKIQKKSKVAIFTHRTPDPDAIGSALGLKWILENKYDCVCDIFYSGEVSHPQNKTMLNVLNINLKQIEEFNQKNYNIFACVDTTPKNVEVSQDLKFGIIIDHHRTEYQVPENQEIIYHSIEPVGSAVSLVLRLMRELELTFENEDEDRIVATAMLLGLITDTNNLLSDNCAGVDYDAHQELVKNADLAKIKAIMEFPFPRYLFELESVALKEENYELKNGVFISFLGMLSPAKRDAISSIADKMGRMEGVTTTIIFAMIEDSIEVSMRSSNVSLDVDAFVKKVFGKAYAGGKQGAGGAKVPLGFFSPADQPEEVKIQLADTIKGMLMYKITKELAND